MGAGIPEPHALAQSLGVPNKNNLLCQANVSCPSPGQTEQAAGLRAFARVGFAAQGVFSLLPMC